MLIRRRKSRQEVGEFLLALVDKAPARESVRRVGQLGHAPAAAPAGEPLFLFVLTASTKA